MPRQSRGRSSSTPRSAPASAPVQSRGAHTAAAPAGAYAQPHHAPAPPAAAAAASSSHAQPQQPGMFAQMAATAGSVAVGSTIGHGISSMLFGGGGGGSSEAAVPVQQAAPVQQQSGGLNCEYQAKEFTKCLEKADLPTCTWYLEQLKACQAAAAPY